MPKFIGIADDIINIKKIKYIRVRWVIGERFQLEINLDEGNSIVYSGTKEEMVTLKNKIYNRLMEGDE